MFRSEDDKDAPFMDTYIETAKEHKNKILFAYTALENEYLIRMARVIFGIQEKDLPTLRAFKPKNHQKYKIEK